MARTQSISEADLIGRLSLVFRDRGYEGAALADLASAAGLKKASLYHRFPGGKQQMAEEVMAAALAWYRSNVLEPLSEPGPPPSRLAAVVERLRGFYDGGRRACLLNMLSAPDAATSPFASTIKAAFEAIAAAFAGIARESGHAPAEARRRGDRAVMLLHGSLVMARGLASPAPFEAFLDDLPRELLAEGDRS
jgi:TetR/AcrR family transcriptional regulator, lmrAB and yxaGH operons repressor